MGKKKTKIFGMTLPVFILLLLAISFVIPSPSGQTYGMDLVNTITGLTPGAGIVPGGQAYYGNVQFIINRHDHLAGGAVTPTSDLYELFHSDPAQGVGGIAITPAGTTTEIMKGDNGVVWMALYGGTDFYLVEDYFVSSNPRIKESYWKDYDVDGDEDFIIKLDVSDVGVIGAAQTPTCTLSLPLLDEDVAGLTSDSPADISSIGTSEVVQTVTWKLSAITAEDGAFLTRLYFVTNCTRGGDDLRFEELSLSGGWTASSGCRTYWGSPVKEENGDYEVWYINPVDYLEYNQGERVWRDTNEADTLYVSVNVRCTFEANEDHLIDIYADFLDPDGSSITTVNDQIKLST